MPLRNCTIVASSGELAGFPKQIVPAKARIHKTTVSAVAGVQLSPVKPAVPAIHEQSTWQQPRIFQLSPVQRAPRRSPFVMHDRPQHDHLSAWAAKVLRQVGSLPQGQQALSQLLHAVDLLLERAENCGAHKHVMQAYLSLGLVDVLSQTWQQYSAQLQAMATQMPSEQHQQLELQSRLALAGCRYLRLEAANALARQLHILLDNEGYSPSLNLAALPAPHALGLPIPQLLKQGLGIDLENPVIREAQGIADLCGLSYEQYTEKAVDTSMCGHWVFCYWLGDATWVPAPHGKFSTTELASLLTPQAILASLSNGIWGRALVSASQEHGLTVSSFNQQQQQPAAAAASGMPGAVKQLLEESMGLQVGGDFRAQVRQFSAAVVAARAALLGGTQASSSSCASVQSS